MLIAGTGGVLNLQQDVGASTQLGSLTATAARTDLDGTHYATDGAQIYNSPVRLLLDDVTVTASHATFNSSVDVALNLEIQADEIDFLGGVGSIAGQGTGNGALSSGALFLQPRDQFRDINVGGSETDPADGILNVSTVDFAAIADHFERIEIGVPVGGTHPISLNSTGLNAGTFSDVKDLLVLTGFIIFTEGDPQFSGDGALEINGPSVVRNSDITAASIFFNGDVLIGTDGITFTSTAGDITFEGRLASEAVNGSPATSEFNSLNLVSQGGTGNVFFRNEVGSFFQAESSTGSLVDAFGAPLNQLNITAGQVVFEDGPDPALAGGGVVDQLGVARIVSTAPITMTSVSGVETALVSAVEFAAPSVTIDHGINAGGNALTVSADEIDFLGGSGSIRGSGEVVLRTSNPNLGMFLAFPDGDTPGRLDFTQTDYQALADGFTQRVFGRPDGAGVLTVATLTSPDSLVLQGSDLVLDGATVTTTDPGSGNLTLIASGASGSIDNNGGNVVIDIAGQLVASAPGSGSIRIAQNKALNVAAINAGTGGVFLSTAAVNGPITAMLTGVQNNIGLLDAGAGTVELTTAGNINDLATGDDAPPIPQVALDIIAGDLLITAGGGVGDLRPLEVATPTVDIAAGGDIQVAVNQAVQVSSLTSSTGAIRFASDGTMTIGDGTVPGVDVVLAAREIALLAGVARPTAGRVTVGEADLLLQGNVVSGSSDGNVLLYASRDILADNASTLLNAVNADFQIGAANLDAVAGNFIGTSDGTRQTNPLATNATNIFVQSEGDAFIVSPATSRQATTPTFDTDTLFGNVLAGIVFIGGNLQNQAANQALAAAGESQQSTIDEEGYIDPALYDLSLSIFDIIAPGIKLPPDQEEDDDFNQFDDGFDAEFGEFDASWDPSAVGCIGGGGRACGEFGSDQGVVVALSVPRTRVVQRFHTLDGREVFASGIEVM